MKKVFKIVTASALAASFAFSVAACAKKDSKKISIELLVGNDEGAEVPKIAQMIKSQLETNLPELEVVINQTTKKNRLNKIQNDCDYQVSLTRWGPDYADPMTYFGMWITDTSNNYGLWSNKDYDALIKACSDGSLTYEQRWEKLYEAEKIVMEEAVIAPLFTKSNANMIKSNVTGVEFHPVALNRVYKNAKKEGGGALNVMLGTSVKSLDAQVATDGESFEVIADYTDGLMQMNAEGAVVNAIAESYTASEDGKTYTFKIRDAVWANGAEVTAQDFVFGWQHGCDAAKEYAYMFSDIGQVKNAEKILKGVEKEDGTKYTVADLGVTAVDKDTLKVELEVPVPYFLSLMYFPTFYPVNEAFYNQVGAEKYATTADTVLANGAFKLKTYTAGGSVVELEKNDKYWNKDKIALDGIKYQVLGDSTAALSAYQSGTLDLVTVSGSQMDQVKGSAELKTTGAGYMWYLTFAQKEGTTTTYPDGFPTRSKNLRLAITNAIDRKAIADGILKDGSLPTYTACPPQFATCSEGAHKGEDYAANQERYKDVCSYDPAKALKYFAAAKVDLGIE